MPTKRQSKVDQSTAAAVSAHQDSMDDVTTVYFDGSCPLCTVEIGHYASRSGGERLNFVDVSEPAADLGPAFSVETAMSRFHVRLPDGRLESGGRTFIAIWAALPGWRWAARIARVPGVSRVLEGAYRLFLPVRPALSWLAGRLGARPRNTGRQAR